MEAKTKSGSFFTKSDLYVAPYWKFTPICSSVGWSVILFKKAEKASIGALV